MRQIQLKLITKVIFTFPHMVMWFINARDNRDKSNEIFDNFISIWSSLLMCEYLIYFYSLAWNCFWQCISRVLLWFNFQKKGSMSKICRDKNSRERENWIKMTRGYATWEICILNEYNWFGWKNIRRWRHMAHVVCWMITWLMLMKFIFNSIIVLTRVPLFHSLFSRFFMATPSSSLIM